jgi:DNA topoisomerase-1
MSAIGSKGCSINHEYLIPESMKSSDVQFPDILPDDPRVSAYTAGLRYVTDQTPGIIRKRAGKGFYYIGNDGKHIRDPKILTRIRGLAIPPAWQDVWICSNPDGHLQATGRDAKGRKQHRYHQQWREIRDATKYERLTAFVQALPRIRRTIKRDLSKRVLSREKILATVVRLLETTLIRVGNEEYARHNNSFGLTTMRDRHVKVNGATITFQFQGKSGIQHAVDLTDPRLAKIVKQSQELPGYELFQYTDENGKPQSIESADVNAYLRDITGQDFTAKDFRTWAGTVLAARALQEFRTFDSQAQAKRNVVQAIESVAKRMGNTKAVCRKCYVHPGILNSYMEGTLIDTLRKQVNRELSQSLRGLPAEEAAVLTLLQQQLKPANSAKKKPTRKPAKK